MAFPTVYRPSNGIWQGSSTATTGGAITLSVAAAAGKLNFRDRYANGATGVPLELQDSTSGAYEFSYGTLTYGGGGPSTDTISARVITFSSNGVATPVTWGAGTRNAWCNVAAESFLFKENAFAEFNIIELAHALANLGISFGVGTGDIPQLIGTPVAGNLPAIGGANLSSLPPTYSGTLTFPYTGGADNKIVRFVSYNTSTGVVTVTTANAGPTPTTDTPAQLRTIWVRGSDSKLYRPNSFVPFASVSAGLRYCLGSSGAIVSFDDDPFTSTAPNPPVPDGVNTFLDIGFGAAANVLYFDPRHAILGNTGSGSTMKLHLGNFTA